MLRLVLDLFIYLARHMPLTFLLVVGASWWLSGRGRLGSWGRRSPLRRTAVGAGWVLVLLFVAIGGWYLTEDGFAGEVEPVVACLSWLVETGRPLYTDFDAAERYSVLYGPSVFLTNGLFLKVLGPSLASAKLASLLGNLGALLFLYLSLARRRRDPFALGAVAVAVLYFWTQGFAVYLVRPDALLVFAVGLGLYGATRLPRGLAVLTVAATAGFAINLKAHGLVYFLPVGVLLHQRWGRRATLAGGALTLATVALPFAFSPQVSLVNYVGWLTNAMSHGLEAHTLGQTFGYAAFLLLPVLGVLLAAPDRAAIARRHRLELLTLVPVYGLTLLLASKPGAGPVHLLPLVPTTIHLLAVLAREVHAAERPGRWSESVVTATLVTALLAGSVNAYRAVRFVDYQIAQTPDLAADVRQIMADYPGLTISMACGGENKAFRTTFLRPLLVFNDNPLLIDPISVMDANLSGRELSPETYRAIEDGRVAMWLVPRSEQPFAKVNWYAPHDELFPADFRAHFRQWYSVRGHSRYFDLWFWNGLEVPSADTRYVTGSPAPRPGQAGGGTAAAAVLNNP
ncbi:hypothetical protein KDM41_01310 [bacterium]|nr:hypothetical protein [bacterium]